MNRYMGIDYGSARIGISISDVLKIIASDFEVIKNTSIKESICRIKDICIEKKVELIVLGLPLNMDGTKGFQALEVEAFGNELIEVIDIKVVYMDERMSTKIAEGVMKEMKMSNEEISRKSDAKAAKERYITITDEDGTDHLAEVIFTFENEDENYVLFTLVEDYELDNLENDYPVLAYKYEELEDGSIGNLIEIPENDHEAWDVVSQMFETFENTNFEG
ncbi:hypothetical protein GJ496_008197 [Pomphorhynchus laevis]|nr:hypothetical protein GJ496_008197 [Pomphorhynchus laevis]